MQTANVLVALGGDVKNTVPKYGVTAAEIAVLQAIHGSDAITDVQPVGHADVEHGDELHRLHQVYGRARDRDNQSIVGRVFPGFGARLTEKIAELSLAPEQFAAKSRASAKDIPAEEPLDEEIDEDDDIGTAPAKAIGKGKKKVVQAKGKTRVVAPVARTDEDDEFDAPPPAGDSVLS